MIFTHSGKLGDALLILPVVSWMARCLDRPQTVMLAQFPYVEACAELMELQDCVSECIITPQQTDGLFGMGGQPYHWSPAKYGYGNSYYNLGFRAYPDKYVPEFYAEEYNLGVDYGFVLQYGEPIAGTEPVKADRWESPMIENVEGVPLGNKRSLIQSLQISAGAPHVSAANTGIAIALALARIPFTLYVEESKREHHLNYFTEGSVTNKVFI